MFNCETLSEFFKALGHPMRLRILQGLMDDECNVDRMTQKLQLPQSTVSQHLGILRRAGILTARKEGVRTCYRIADPRIRKLLNLCASA